MAGRVGWQDNPPFTPQQRSKSLADFNAAMKETAEKLLPEQVRLLQQKVVLELLRRVVLKTPVDTGRARGNWQVTIGAAPEGQVTVGEKPDTKEAKTESVVAGSAINRGTQVALGLKPFSICYITNNVPYIVFLENGSSTQAPAGMVTLSIQELQAMFS